MTSRKFILFLVLALNGVSGGWIMVGAQTTRVQPQEIPVTRGHSRSAHGMFYYDVDEARDGKVRNYVYTICPPEITCINLDFTLLESSTGEDFVNVYLGDHPAGEPYATLGGASGDSRLQIETNCITVEFLRDSTGYQTAWTAVWHSYPGEGCGPLKGSPQECSNVQEICGPRYHEKFLYFGSGEKEELTGAQVCLTEEHNSIWYRFRARRDGELSFLIVPDNHYDDYDWVLWKGKESDPDDCSVIQNEDARIACNYSSAKGARGATGMDIRGEGLTVGSDGSPFCKTVPVKRGEVYFLMVDDFSQQQSGFWIELGDAVRQCEKEEVRDFVSLGVEYPPLVWKVPPKYQFSRYSRILRINMDEKMNEPLLQATHNGDLLDGVRPLDMRGNGNKPVPAPACTGIVEALLEALKAGKITALAANDPLTPLNYGDILDAAYQLSSTSQPGTDYWNQRKKVLAPFENSIELIVDEMIDRVSGREVRQIRFIRLIWSDGDGALPDKNIALFSWDNVAPLLDHLMMKSRHTDVSTLSVKDALETGQFSSIQIWRSGKASADVQDAKYNANQQVEYENYLWSH